MDIAIAALLGDLGRTLSSHGTVLTFLFVVSLVLVFLFAFALRDVLQKRGQRLRSSKPVASPPRRA